MPIQQLPPHIAAQIAAGEVIERPASVVKELVENALDAGAARIGVAIRQGGVAEISVADDGCGIPAGELALAFQHHATSKLTAVADLAAVATLGFRGEALPSIAAVARVSCRARPHNAEAGARIEFRYGDLVRQTEVGCPAGATVQVIELFGNLPARRRFLRSAAAEAARAQEVVTSYALSHPEVRFTFTVDDREQLNTPGSGRLQDAILAVYGAETAARMLPVDHAASDPVAGNHAAADRAAAITVSGYTGAADLTRGNRAHITLLVNRRWVQSRRIAYAVEQAYRGQLPDRRYPVAVINIALPPGMVDVNSHPAKREVRFRNENAVFTAVHRAVGDALLAHAPARTATRAFAPPGGRGAAAPVPEQQDGPVAPYDGGPSQSSSPPPSPDRLALPVSAGATTGASLREVLAGLRVVGQIRQTYIVAEGEGGMYLVDQHAAHERVLYDRIRPAAAGRERATQPLLAPLPAELSLAQVATLREYAALLAEYGFDLEAFGGNAWLVRALPAALAERRNPDPARALAELLDAVAVEQVVMEREDALAATIACHAAVRAGKTLAYAEMDALLRQLEATPNPHHCPHGRPTVVHFTEYQLEREFGRR